MYTYTYRKMPSGLINTGATFQRAMDIAFQGLMNISIVVYKDEITVCSYPTQVYAKGMEFI